MKTQTILTDEELLKVLKNGVWAKLEGLDKEYRRYNVISFSSYNLLICVSGINWNNGETSHYPHTVSQRDKNEVWFFENPMLKENDEQC